MKPHLAANFELKSLRPKKIRFAVAFLAIAQEGGLVSPVLTQDQAGLVKDVKLSLLVFPLADSVAATVYL